MNELEAEKQQHACTIDVLEQTRAERDALLSRLQAAEARWVPWKPCDPAPMPCFRTQYLCTVRRMGTLDPVWVAIRDGHMFDDGTCTEVVAYRSEPLPPPYVAALTSTQEKT